MMGMFDRTPKVFTKRDLDWLDHDVRRWWTQGADSYPMPMLELLDLIEQAKKAVKESK